MLLVGFGLAGGFFANRVPSSFLPDEDQGYAFVNMQLPNGASMERTTAAAADVEKILASTPGVQYTTSVIGFSLLSYVRTRDRKSTRLNSSHLVISYAVFCLKKKKRPRRTLATHCTLDHGHP